MWLKGEGRGVNSGCGINVWCVPRLRKRDKDSKPSLIPFESKSYEHITKYHTLYMCKFFPV